MLKYMLDTNIVIYTMKNKPDSVRERFKKHHGRMCISCITYMELVYGVERSSNPDRNLTSLEGYVARMDVYRSMIQRLRMPGRSEPSWPD